MCDMCNNVQIYKTSDFVKELEAMNVSEYAFDSEQSETSFDDAIVSYINATGHLCLTGELTENGSP